MFIGEADPDTKIQFVPNVNNIAPRPGHWSEKKKEYALKKAKGIRHVISCLPLSFYN